MQEYSVNQIKKISGTLTSSQLQNVNLLNPIIEVPAGLRVWALSVYYDFEISNNTLIPEIGIRNNIALNAILLLAITPQLAPYAWSGIVGQNNYPQLINPSNETNPLCNNLNFVAASDLSISVNYFRYELTYFVL